MHPPPPPPRPPPPRGGHPPPALPPLQGGNTRGRAKPVPRCFWVASPFHVASFARSSSAGFALSCDVVLPLRCPCDQRRRHQRRHHRNHRRKRLRRVTHQAHVGRDRQSRGQAHGAHAHGVDVVQVRAFELDARRAPA